LACKTRFIAGSHDAQTSKYAPHVKQLVWHVAQMLWL